MTRTRLRWQELSTAQRRLVVLGGALQLTLLAWAQVDLARRPASQVVGSKTRWRLVTLVNGVGPVAYLVRGRRHAPGAT